MAGPPPQGLGALRPLTRGAPGCRPHLVALWLAQGGERTAAGAERRSEKGTFFLEGEVLPSQSLRKKCWDWRRPGSFVQPALLSDALLCRECKQGSSSLSQGGTRRAA